MPACPSSRVLSAATALSAVLALPSAAVAAPDFAIASPDKVDVSLLRRGPDTVPIEIHNTGDAAVTLSVLPTVLVDASTGHRQPLGASRLGTCAAGSICDFTVTLPRPAYAGAYSGALTLSADGALRRSVPVVLRTRGPNFVPWGWDEPLLPVGLFWLVTIVGFLLSSAVDAWFAGGGRRRVQARLLVERSAARLADVQVFLAAWPNAADTATSLARVRAALNDAEHLRATAEERAVDLIETDAQTLALRANQAAALRLALEAAAQRFSGAALAPIVAALDAVDPGRHADVVTYRKALEAAMVPTLEGREAGASAMTLPAMPLIQRLAARSRLMDALYSGVVCLTVGLVAYLMFFDRAFSFGTARDYINLFLWTLGLTQTGSQILARTKSSQTAK
jgi:hypothetical protein